MSNLILHETEVVTYHPKAALIVYEGCTRKFLELHSIRRDGSLAEGRAVSRRFLTALMDNFSTQHRSTPHGFLPSNMLYADTRAGQEVYVWYNSPRKRLRYFDERLGLEDGNYYVPGVLYIVKEKTLYVFCFSGKKPSIQSEVLGVPFFNVYKEGRVCMGSAYPNIPDTVDLSYDDVLKAWEDAFWNSMDVHTNGSPSTVGNLIETIKKYKDKPFDTKSLVKRKENIGQIIKQIVGNS